MLWGYVVTTEESPDSEVSDSEQADDGSEAVPDVPELEAAALLSRMNIVTMIAKAGSGHPGGSLSATDILTVLYFRELNIRPDRVQWPMRDRFVLSKGHGAPGLYSQLALRGYFPVADLFTLRELDSHLQGHPSMALTRGVEMSTGSLGQGLSVSVGMAMASRIDHADGELDEPWRAFALLGDGELQSGQVWEAAMAAGHLELDNLIAFVDNNGIQIDGFTCDIMKVEPVDEKFRAFGWRVMRLDEGKGHDIGAIIEAVAWAKKGLGSGQPSMIVADTVKGKGVSFMENTNEFHGRAPTLPPKDDAEYPRAMEELKARAGGVLPYKGVVLTEEVCINALGELRVQENQLKGGA